MRPLPVVGVSPRPKGRAEVVRPPTPVGERDQGPDPVARLLSLGQRRLRVARLKRLLRSSLWFIPAVAFTAAIGLSLITTFVDRHFGESFSLPFGLALDADSARGFLSLISSWMLTFVGLAFTMTIVVLQLASAQFSPRVLSTLLRDRYSQLSLGIFIGTFAYAFLVMREVRSGSGQEFVPAISMATAFTLVLLSLGVFIRYVNHVAHSIRAGSVISTVANATRAVLEEMLPRSESVPRDEDWWPYRTIPAPKSGVLLSFDAESLVVLAQRRNIVLEIVPGVGKFSPRGAPLVRIVGDSGALDEAEVLGQIEIGPERTMQQDPAFGFRQLVDIAERALSPGVNDPTTAVQVIDQLNDLLRDMLDRDFPTGIYVDASGTVRLVVPTLIWEDFLRLAVEEIRHYGANSIQVSRRLRTMLEDLRSIARTAERSAIDRELKLLHEVAKEHFPEVEDAVGEPRR